MVLARVGPPIRASTTYIDSDMYKQLIKQDIQRILKVPETYTVDGLLVIGTHPKLKEYPHIYEALSKLNSSYTEEKLEDTFFSDIKSFGINGKRIWFDVVYGTAYLSELIHVASMLGSKANILLGTCGSLKENLNMGDTIIPKASYGNESSTRMYQPGDSNFLYESNVDLSYKLKNTLSHRKNIDEGKLVTVQAMLAETKEDVDRWANEGYSGIDMESATMFAVSNHFNVPSAALLYVADNLIKNQLTTDESFELLRTQRTSIRKENYEIALRTLLQ
jgi:purine-nucleoside phosphorylase